jgi:hypothetical protein
LTPFFIRDRRGKWQSNPKMQQERTEKREQGRDGKNGRGMNGSGMKKTAIALGRHAVL